MATSPNDVRLQILMKLQEELDMEAALEEEMLNLFSQFLERVRLHRPKIIRLGSHPDNPLVDHEREILERLTGADMRNAIKMVVARHELHRSMAEKVKMDDPNITMEEYIRLEEEKARRRGKVYNWETTTYGKMWYDEDVHDLRSVETEFPAIVFNDALTFEVALSCETTVSPLNDNQIDFRISFDESDDEYYTVIYDKNSFSYKIIYVDDLKTDLENDNDEVNMPSFPSPKPTNSYFNDLDYIKDFEKEFPAIVYNDALTSKLDFLTEPTVSPQHIDEFDLKDETSLSECDEEEQNILYFNDLFPFNVIYPDDSKSDKDNDDDKIDIKQSSRGPSGKEIGSVGEVSKI
ncbi:hypothetical protein Tco_1564369 [Tanacetum coccineum]